MDGIDKAVAERLKEARTNAGLSISQVAKLYANLHSDFEGASRQVFKEWLEEVESGLRSVVPGQVSMLADIYLVDARWIMTEETTLDVAGIERMSSLPADEKAQIIRLLSSLKREE
jgi:hypothetical protein